MRCPRAYCLLFHSLTVPSSARHAVGVTPETAFPSLCPLASRGVCPVEAMPDGWKVEGGKGTSLPPSRPRAVRVRGLGASVAPVPAGDAVRRLANSPAPARGLWPQSWCGQSLGLAGPPALAHLRRPPVACAWLLGSCTTRVASSRGVSSPWLASPGSKWRKGRHLHELSNCRSPRPGTKV